MNRVTMVFRALGGVWWLVLATHLRVAIASTGNAVQMASVHAIPAGSLEPTELRVRSVHKVSSWTRMAIVQVSVSLVLLEVVSWLTYGNV